MRRSASFFFAVSLVSCGSRSETSNPPQQTKNSFFAQIETPKVSPEVVKGAYAELPATTSALLRFHDPWKWVSTSYQAAKKLAPAEVEEFEKMATTEAGFNLFDLKAVNDASGLDVSKPLSVFMDSALHVKTSRKDVFTETASTVETFALVMQATLSNKEKFASNLQLIATKNSGRAVSAEANGATITYLYHARSAFDQTEVIHAAVSSKDSSVKAIIIPEGVDATSEAEFKKQIEAYATTPPAKALSENEFFSQITAHADPTGDMFLFIDVASFATSVEGMLGPIAQGPEAAKVKEVTTKIVASFPGMASSVSFSDKGIRGTGAVKLIAPQVPGMRSMLPTKDAPAYGAIFPESINYFTRTSTNLLGLKDYAMYLVPKEYAPMVESYMAIANAAVGGYVPLNIDADILGAFTGHMAYGADYTSMLAAPTPMPKFFFVGQLTSEAAGDKILAAILDLPAKLGAPFPIKTEEVDGNKLYSITEGPMEVAWGRASDLLLIGFGVQSVKDMMTRVKTPGASFVDKSGSELAKNMVNSKTGSGTYVDFGVVMMSMLTSPEFAAEPKVKEIISKIAPVLGPMVSQSNYNPETQLDVSIIEMSFK